MSTMELTPRAIDADSNSLEQEILRKARRIAAEFKTHAGGAEALSRYPETVHELIRDLGLYKLLIPQNHGGLEVSPRLFYKVVIELARGDMGCAWGFALAANHAMMFANWFPEEIHEEIFAGGEFRAASMYAPTVKAQKVDGGWRLEGTVNFCSGIPYSTHFIGQCMLPEPDADGKPRFGLYIAPASSFEILDDWGNLHGLNASGSNSIRFTGDVIPDRYMVEGANLVDYAFDGHSPGSKAYGNAMYSGRHMSTFAIGLAALCIGAGLSALDEYEQVMRERKTSLPPFVPRTDDPDYQRWFGSALVKLKTSEAALFATLEEWAQAAELNVSGEAPFTAQHDNLLGAVARELIVQVWETVDTDLYRTIGSAASRRGNRFERVFRDLAQALGHRNPALREPSYRLIATDHLRG